MAEDIRPYLNDRKDVRKWIGNASVGTVFEYYRGFCCPPDDEICDEFLKWGDGADAPVALFQKRLEHGGATGHGAVFSYRAMILDRTTAGKLNRLSDNMMQMGAI